MLDALGVTDGAMHTEVMSTPRGPVLVEVNCRLHGGEGIWLPIAQVAVRGRVGPNPSIWLPIAQACLRYTQLAPKPCP